MIFKRIALLTAVSLMLSILSGCLYPDEKRDENQISGKEYVQLVQNAVNEYYEQTRLLPIKNSEMDTPIYEKHVIDFRKLRERRLLSLTPPNAFENGGTNLYVLIDVEQEPKVKLLDLVSLQKTGEVEEKVQNYVTRNRDIPNGEPASDRFYYIDYEKLGGKSNPIRSVYSNVYLGLLVHESGTVAIDYGPEIMRLVERLGIEPNEDEDLRALLAEHSFFVPVRSYAYIWRDNAPVPTDKLPK